MANSKESAIILAEAVKSGNVSVVRELVESLNLDCHAVFEHPENTDRATFLHMAVDSKRTNVVKYLIEERGVNVDQRLADGRTPLHKAASAGYYDIVELLVENGADCDAIDKRGYSPCHFAARKGDAKIIKFLVKHGNANINNRAETGISPFHLAAMSINDSSFLKLLIDLGADFSASDVFGHSALHYAVTHNKVSTVKFLIEEKYLDPNKCYVPGRNFLHFVLFSKGEREALTEGEAAIAEYLVKERKMNVNEVVHLGRTPLHLACWLRDVNIVKLLVDGGADCNVSDDDGDSPLHHSVRVGKVDIVKYLIEKTDVVVSERNLKGETPMHVACKFGKLDCLKLLLDNGADINSVDNRGRHCLHLAVIRDNADIVQYLVKEKKFDANRVTTGEPLTSLNLAASWGHLNLCKLLVELGADYALRDMEGNSALHYAARKGHVNILEYFIKELGQDANKCINKYGYSPLHLACERDHVDCVKFLTENGADYKLLDNRGKSCLDFAS